MSNGRFGNIVIDELRLCYCAEPEVLSSLQAIPVGERVDFDEFSIIRIISPHIKYSFGVVDANNKSIAYLYFGLHIQDDNEYGLIWLKIENSILYTDRLQSVINVIKNTFNLQLNNITVIDLSLDLKFNIAYAIRKYMKDPAVTTIINGKAIKDRKKVIKDMFYIYKASIDRIKEPSLYIAQQKAMKNKSKGLHMKCYNKKSEIEEHSDKEYILNFYNNPQTLHRLEVHQNRDEIIDFCKKSGVEVSENLIFDNNILSEMFFYHLSSMLRFTKGRCRVDWRDVLKLK